jgi:hypothetical protein
VTCSASVGRWCPKAEKKMVPRTATPSEVDSCCLASRTPEADPTSVYVDAVEHESEELGEAGAGERQAGDEIPGGGTVGSGEGEGDVGDAEKT